MAAGMGPLAGCGVFEATTEEDDPAAAREEQVAAANDHLKQIFDTLAEYDIVADGRPAVDPDAYTSEDLGVLRQELEGAQTAVAELDELGREAETPVPSSEVVRGGTLLASVRVEMYGRARELAVQDRAAHAALGEQNFERVQTIARGFRQ